MRYPRNGRWLRPRRVALVLVAAFAGLMSLVQSPAIALTDAPDDYHLGQIEGWRDGFDVTMFFSAPPFCRQPPESGARSGCEAGEDAQQVPRTEDVILDVVFLIPSGFTPARETLSCARKFGRCPGHPRSIDLSREWGPGFESVDTPKHSIVFEGEADDRSVWWHVDIVFVYEEELWEELATEKELEAVEEAQEAGEPISEDIPTNLFIYFFAPEGEPGGN